ncbi:MAG TPA: preprotein translocase subunit SecE [Pyrinomonadaceae bacterium]|nr:preprotein translocase subunit SecE [Pyrinomonadaceae bacterium]
MAEIDKADASIGAPDTSSYSERGESKVARRDHGRAQQNAAGRIVQFVRDVRAEMKRVSWPNASTVKNTTIITLIAVIFFAIYLFIVDLGMTYLVKGIDWVIARLANFLGIG